MDSFKESLERTASTVNSAVRTGQRIALEAILREITVMDYDTISQVKGGIYKELDRLKGEGDE